MRVKFHTNINWEIMELTIPEEEVRNLSRAEKMKLVHEKITDSLDYYIVGIEDG